MTPGEGRLTYVPGKSLANYDHSLAKKIYGGLAFDHNLSLEAGALKWGYQFLVPTKGSQTGSTQALKLKVNMLYVAGKASMSKNLDLVMAFHRAGSVKGVPQQTLEAGVRWHF
jgi:hypothetical protein